MYLVPLFFGDHKSLFVPYIDSNYMEKVFMVTEPQGEPSRLINMKSASWKDFFADSLPISFSDAVERH